MLRLGTHYQASTEKTETGFLWTAPQENERQMSQTEAEKVPDWHKESIFTILSVRPGC